MRDFNSVMKPKSTPITILDLHKEYDEWIKDLHEVLTGTKENKGVRLKPAALFTFQNTERNESSPSKNDQEEDEKLDLSNVLEKMQELNSNLSCFS